jgi:hypothetical protein
VLLILGVAERAVMGIMGWSDSGMARRYQHVTAQVRRDIAKADRRAAVAPGRPGRRRPGRRARTGHVALN